MKVLVFLMLIMSTSSLLASDCFWANRVRSFKAVNNEQLILDAGRTDYLVDLNHCWDLKWADRIAFKSFSGSNRVCKFDKVLVLDNFSNHIKQECLIRNITKLDK